MRRLLAPVAILAISACGPYAGNVTADGGGNVNTPASDGSTDGAPPGCDSPCECAERGSPDHRRENAGRTSGTSDEAQRAALVRANHWRTSAGLAPFDADPQIEQAATAHARFMATTPQSRCWPNPHNEVEANCPGFTGITMGNRMTAAGYQWSRASEVINWEADPVRSIDGWIWTVYHRQPFMDWRLVHEGFGREQGPLGTRTAMHNVMDFGTPRSNPNAVAPSQPAVFPVPGQIDVPPAFRGDLEGPTPPSPDGSARWPSGRSSGTVVSVHFPTNTWDVTAHRLFRSASATCEEVDHVFVSRANDPNLNRGTPSNDVFLYARQPLQANTEYVVQIEGTFNNAPYTRTWAFMTR